GPKGDITFGEMGGAGFSNWDTPNSSNPDYIWQPCPNDDPAVVGDPSYGPDPRYTAPCIAITTNWYNNEARAAARSKHPGGVNASLGDASVRFFSNNINLSTWRAAGTKTGGEVLGSDF